MPSTLPQTAQPERQHEVGDALAQAHETDVDDEEDHLLAEVAGHPEREPDLEQADDELDPPELVQRA